MRRRRLDFSGDTPDPTPAQPAVVSCETCPWFVPLTAEQQARCVPGYGFCHAKLPPQLTGLLWGKQSSARITDPVGQACVLHPDILDTLP